MAFRTVHPAWLDQTSSSSSIDTSSTQWKSASGNSSKSLIPIQRSDRKLWPFEPSIKPGSTRSHDHRVSIPHPMRGKGHPETPVKVRSRSTGWIESYGLSTVHLAWLDQTSSSPSIDPSSTAWKSLSGNSSKSLIAIQRSDRKLWPFKLSMQPGSTRPYHHRVSIPHPMRGTGHSETPVKV